MYWITESSVVEGKIKVDTGTGIVRLRHPAGKQVGDIFKQEGKTDTINTASVWFLS